MLIKANQVKTQSAGAQPTEREQWQKLRRVLLGLIDDLDVLLDRKPASDERREKAQKRIGKWLAFVV